ncbi:hypothetical protein HU811_01915 [Pseudomonas sp. SWRI196]|uniref:Uncharacterized protein n=1 Tax=Pseudomonas tehranensis TaxID=2745502 RepID=A0ABR6ULK0_9PSED|nr:hypothetical protein [Pseudomonas tehranensis]MBC3345389.1 hypothetical protein [Pseudomonas tehranensis]
MSGNVSKAFRAIGSFWFISMLSILIAFVFAIYFYRLRFGGGLSSNSSDWSNFGSYIGGVFGPLVSFVTLLAVLKTVYLQRELLDTQRDEFSAMQALQRDTFHSQQKQLKQAAEATSQDQYHRVLEHLLGMVDRHSASYGNIVNRVSQGLETLANWKFEGRPVSDEHFIILRNKNIRHNKTLESLALLSVDLSLNDFGTMAEMREHYRIEMHKIFEAESVSEEGEAEV